MSSSLKIVFAGTPEFAALHLSALLDTPYEIVGVYTQPDRPAGRGKKLQASAVKQVAQANELPIFQPESLKTPESQQVLAELGADIMIVVAYGLILPKAVLDTPRLGCLNVHGSLLPKWRGAAPIQRAIWAGDKETGVTIMQMDEGLDTGAMLLKQALPIEPLDTSASLYTKLAEIGPKALIDTLHKLTELTAESQDEAQVSYAHKLSKQEAKINWSESAQQLERNIRAFNPWPVAFFSIQDTNIKVHQGQVEALENAKFAAGEIVRADKNGILVATGNQGLLLTSLQLPGKKPLSAADILNARKDWFIAGHTLP